MDSWVYEWGSLCFVRLFLACFPSLCVVPFLFICFCFILFYSYPLDTCFCFLTRVRKGANSDGRGVGEELEGEERRETVIRKYCMGGVVYFQWKKYLIANGKYSVSKTSFIYKENNGLVYSEELGYGWLNTWLFLQYIQSYPNFFSPL